MSKKLVAFFSASGVTRKAAGILAEAVGADQYEIKAKIPYTDADLNWMDEQSRNYVEMHNPGFRPEIEDTDAHIADYDVVYLGYPVWWHTCPQVINTFLEKYDFSGKKIILWQTSGGSGFENAFKDVKASVSDTAEVTEWRNLNWKLDVERVKAWAESVG